MDKSKLAAANGDLFLPNLRKHKSQLSFHNRAVTSYNFLPQELRNIQSKTKFKKKLVSYIKGQFSYKIYDAIKTRPRNGDPG